MKNTTPTTVMASMSLESAKRKAGDGRAFYATQFESLFGI